MALDPVRGHLFVAGRATNSVYVIDTNTLQVIKTIPVGKEPLGVAFLDPYVYVANHESDSVHLIDAQQLMAVSQVLLGLRYGVQPTHLAVDPAHKKVYVVLSARSRSSNPTPDAASQLGQILEMDAMPPLVQKQMEVGPHAYGVALSPAKGYLFVSSQTVPGLAMLNTSNFVQIVSDLPRAERGIPLFVATNEDGQVLYWTHSSGPQSTVASGVSVFPLANQRDIPIGGLDLGNMGEDGGYIAVYPHDGSSWADSVWISAGNRVVVTTPQLGKLVAEFTDQDGLGKDAYAIVIDAPSGRVYVGDANGAQITVISLK